MSRRDAVSLTEILRWRGEQQADREAYGEWGDFDVAAWLTYGELDRKARAIGAALQGANAAGERALLLYPPGFEYIAAFFGCLYGNVIAVPAYPPEPTRLDRTLPRLRAIIADARATIVLTTTDILSLVGLVEEHAPELAALNWIATDSLDDADAWKPLATDRETVAFLQYTSGSTGLPKGVVVTHGNLLHNSVAIQKALGSTPDTLKVSWVPPYHDMGLIGCIVQSLFVGFPLVSMSPVAFLLKPFRWLQAISKTRAHISGAPNFALDLCVQKITPEQRARLDLSCWKSLYVSAEPIRRDTLERFAGSFAECGFDRSAFYPTYGLAEATLVVAGGAKGTGFSSTTVDSDEAHSEVVSVGRSIAPGGEMLIVDPDTCAPLPDGRVGEIWVRSASVARGYWNRIRETDETFNAHTADGAGPYMRSGDLGFMKGDELFITGRRKEVIIVRGRKHFPTDIEDTIEKTNWNTSHYRAGGTAAFSLIDDGDERLCVAVEVERRRRDRRASQKPSEERRRGADRRSRPFAYKATADSSMLDATEVVRAIRRAIANAHGLEPWAVILLRPGAIPKTSSGKKQRVLCRKRYLEDAPHRDVLHVWRANEIIVDSPSKRIRIA